MKKHLLLMLSIMLLAPCISLAQPGLNSDSLRQPQIQALLAATPVLWDQPVLVTDQTHAGINQDFEAAFNDFDTVVADDFLIDDEIWSIRRIHLSSLLWNSGTSLTNAKFINVAIYRNDDLADVPVPFGPPIRSLALAPNDPQLSLNEYQPTTGYYASDVTLTLDKPLSLESGSYWLVYSVTMDSAKGRTGWRPGDSENESVAKLINPLGGMGFGTDWIDWLLYNQYSYSDAAFTLDGFVVYRDNFLSNKAKRARGTAEFRPLTVKLQDAFETRSYTAKKQISLLTPTAQTLNDEPAAIANADLHFVGYSLSPVVKSCVDISPENAFAACLTDADCGGLEGGKEFCKKSVPHTPQQNIQIKNQFGTTSVTTIKADSMLVPSVTAPDVDSVVTNHYKCYKVKENNALSKGSVIFSDEFESEVRSFDIKKAYRFCIPAEKTLDNTVSEVIDPDNSYTCYTASLTKKVCTEDSDTPYFPCSKESDCGVPEKGIRLCQKQLPFEKMTNVPVINQFGNQSLNTIKTTNLCVPSTYSRE